tara:strand:+ start:1442 stop:1918 length:477 start_codon:yes stop_codon:yes gene_type:complete
MQTVIDLFFSAFNIVFPVAILFVLTLVFFLLFLDFFSCLYSDFVPARFHQQQDYSLDLVQSKPKGCPNGGPMYGFVPFGAGKRTCPGQRLALLESVIVLASIVKHYQFELAYPHQKIEKLSDITLGPKMGLPIRLCRRKKKKKKKRIMKVAPPVTSRL